MQKKFRKIYSRIIHLEDRIQRKPGIFRTSWKFGQITVINVDKEEDASLTAPLQDRIQFKSIVTNMIAFTSS